MLKFLFFLAAACPVLEVVAEAAKPTCAQEKKETSLLEDARLGICYYLGSPPDTPRDYKKSFYWFQRAADKIEKNIKKDNPYSWDRYSVLNNLGFFYMAGIGCTRDYKKAAYYLTLSAKNSDSKTPYFNLASLYVRGLGVPRDLKKAKILFFKALPIAGMNVFFDFYQLLRQNPKPSLDDFLNIMEKKVEKFDNDSSFFSIILMEKKVENDENDSKERFFTMFQEMMQYGEEISEEWLQLLADIDMMMSTNRERVGFDPSSYSFNYHSRHSLKALTEKMTRLMERMPPSSRSSDE